MSDDATLTTAFRQRNRLLLIGTMIVIAIIGLMIAASLFVLAMKGGEMSEDRTLRMAVGWLPALFYLWALWSICDLFRALARGAFGFMPMVRVLARVGWGLMLGAVTALLITPLLVTLGQDERLRGAFALFNVPALTLAIVGLGLIVLSHMMRRAQAIEAEAARLKATLQEFV
jgi:hypothetical protein